MIAIAQVDIYGYYESEYDYMQFHESNYNFGYNKLRLDLESRIHDKAIIACNVNCQLYYGKTDWDLLVFFPQSINMDTQPLSFSLKDTLSLDNIYLRTSFPKFDLSIGKQPLSFGTGYAWNPLDIFNRKEVIDPTYEQPGVNALRIEIPVAANSVLDIILEPDSIWDMSSKMIQLKSHLGSFDFSLNGGSQYHVVPDGNSHYISDHVTLGGGSFV